MTNSLNVSIVICCYNSAPRLLQTIQHLLAQEVPDGLLWEVIVVDNACTDNTSRVARSLWPDDAPAPLRVVSEPKPGLSNARRKGFEVAQYELVSFVDDDNWVAPNWVRLVSEIMKEHPEAGACGGRTEAVFEDEPPWWFENYASSYVVGKQGDKVGDVTWSRGNLWGAGLTIRKRAWQNLREKGFETILTDRKANQLSSGGDYELCYALRLAGWRLWYSEELILKHFIPSDRLKKDYLARLKQGFGQQTIGFDPYSFYARFAPEEIKSFLGKVWLRQLLREVFISVFRNGSFWKRWMRKREDSFDHFMQWQRHWGRIRALWQAGSRYDHQVKIFEQNQWIRVDRKTANYLYQNPEFGDAGNPELSQTPLVTVLICNYNYGRFLGEAIDSALGQTWKNIEVIVVDDGSTDESREVLKKYTGHIRTILKENGGQASAFNVGIAEARGEIICFLDSDDFWKPEKVERVVEKYREAAWGLVCHEMVEVNIRGALNSCQTLSQTRKIDLRVGNIKDFFYNSGFNWVFSPTSGLNLPSKIAKMVIPINENDWEICADTPLAFVSSYLRPVGVINCTLGLYRSHGVNNWDSKNKMEKELLLLGIKANLYILSNNEKLSNVKDYHFYRRVCYIVRDEPWKYIFQLLKKNIIYHYELFNYSGFILSLKYAFFDLTLSILFLFRIGKPYKKIRIAYVSYQNHIRPKVRFFLEKS